MAYRVLIVEDQIIPRTLFERILRDSGRYEIAASIPAASVADAWCAGGKIDLVLMDVVMKEGVDGIEAAFRIKRSYPSIKILAVSGYPDARFLRRAREAGVDSFWYKEVEDTPMLEVMDRTMAGERVWPDAPPAVRVGRAMSTDLTERETDVLRCLAEGLSDRECAERLNITPSTIRYHLGNLFLKTGLSTRAEVIVHAVRSGVVVPDLRKGRED